MQANASKTQTRRAKVRSGVKVPAEIENWALGRESNDNSPNVDYDSDDFESIDDSYVNNMALSDEDEKKELEEKQRERIRFILRNLQNKDRSKSAKPGETASSSQSQKPVVGQGNEEVILPKRKSKSAKDSGSLKFKSAKSGMTRAVPGQPPQNITIERTYFKDLLKLSQQRYFYKLSVDFQKRAFIMRQKKKNLYKDSRSPSQSFEMATSSRPATSNTMLTSNRTPTTLSRANSYIRYPVKSTSANPKMRTANQEDLPDMDDQQKPMAPMVSSETKVNVIYENVPHGLTQERSILKRPTSSARPGLRVKSGNSRNLSIYSAKLEEETSENVTVPLAQAKTPSADYQRRKSSLMEPRQIQSAVPGSTARLESRINVIQDDRYQSLLNSLSNVYLPKVDTNHHATSSPDSESPKDRHVSPLERVDSIIKSNKALQGGHHTSGDIDHVKRRHDMEANLKLFEKYVSLYT